MHNGFTPYQNRFTRDYNGPKIPLGAYIHFKPTTPADKNDLHEYGPNTLDGIFLGHRRLSILDLSEAGHQPMESSNDRYVIAFNGEIYNHLQIRSEIEKSNKNISWRGHSDTETILCAFETFGIEASIKKFNGMFAFSLWDRKNKVLTLARDRLGEKPMYYGWQKSKNGKVFLFGSELKALKSFPDIDL